MFDPARIALVSFDVFGTLVDVRAGSYGAFAAILERSGARGVDVKAFWEHWEEANIAAYWRPWRHYKAICRDSLAAAFRHYGVKGDADLIGLYFDAFERMPLYPDVAATLAALAGRYRLAVVSNIDDDLLARTPLGHAFDLVCTAERARGYKPDGALFRYLLRESGLGADRILHCGQSQFTDLVGGKKLGLTICWINRRGIALSPEVPRPDHVFADIASVRGLLAGGDRPYTET